MTLEQQEKYSSFAIRFERDDEAETAPNAYMLWVFKGDGF